LTKNMTRHICIPRMDTRITFCGLRDPNTPLAFPQAKANCEECRKKHKSWADGIVKKAMKDRRYIGGTL